MADKCMKPDPGEEPEPPEDEQPKKKPKADPPEDWEPDLRAALMPGSLSRANIQIISGLFSWVTGTKGETLNRVVAILIFGFFAGVLLAKNTWLWWVVAGAWVLGCGGIAVQNAPALEPKEEDEEEDAPGDAQDAGDQHADKAAEARNAQRAAEYAERTRTIIKFVEESMATAFHNGTAEGRGIRVAVLLTAFHKKMHLIDWDEERLTAFLESIGVVVREQMYFKINGKKSNKPGVHVDDLTKLLGHNPRLPAHLVPDLTPQHPLQQPLAHPSTPALTMVKEEGEKGVA